MTKLITEFTEISKGRQSVCYTEVLCSPKHNVKVTIYSDSYDFQSYAKVLTMDDQGKWNVLHSIHYSKMATPAGLIYRRTEPTDSIFKQDRDALMNVANKLLKTKEAL